ncbi:unnamed protein product [Bursaphelenchus xylophilus]|uniref:(pine wood nematode) hypothetical protein n=1 Tax=Bursaphelenchus xylophilus TaxID=6326 RepID=A0A1I7SQT1_BURXY|nr:unnamed protein product [Bursaphelenchus xylophilus]CAG9110348.1 unnamed protein product [Bursaphelenchus xylophilus]
MQLIEKAVECQGSRVINMHSYQQLLWQRRLMAVATLLTIIGIFAFLAAVFHPDWAILDFVNTDLQKVNVRLGVWGEWRTLNTTNKSEYTPHFPEPPGGRILRLADEDIKHYYRAQAAFCVISLVIMVCNNAFALWTFTHHRYIYKRLVAGIHVFTAMCIVVTMEVLTNSVDEWNANIAEKYRNNQEWDFSAVQRVGLGYYLAGTVVIIYIFAAICFFIASHKQKGLRAATSEFEIEDREIEIGR